MISGIHTILYSKQSDALRAFFRDVLEFPSVDAGHGWLIFAAPPGELAVHPADDRSYHQLYLMCTDIKATVEKLKSRGVEFTTPITDQRWGLLTQLRLPDGETLGLYEPRHPTAIRMTKKRRATAKKSASKKRRTSTRKRKR